MDYLKQLRELTDKLPKLDKIVTNFQKNRVDYMVEGGKAYGYGLLKNKDVAIQYAFLSEGTSFPRHTHDSWECIIIVKGKCKVSYNGTEEIIEAPCTISFSPKQGHKFDMITDVEMVGVVVPVDEAYPPPKENPLG